MTRTFLRFAGKLWENGDFEPEYGWETERIARRPASHPDFRLELVDAAGAVLVERGVELRVSTREAPTADAMTRARVVGYLPLRSNGSAVVLRNTGRLLYRTELAPARPRIERFDATIDHPGRLHVRWAAEHTQPLRFDLVFIDGLRRTYPLRRGLSGIEAIVDIAHLPGGEGCGLALLATDGLRSAARRSELFDVAERSPRVAILAPVDGEILMPDQPISLLGHAHDVAGRALSDDGLSWSIDGEPLAQGQRLAPAGPLSPGSHRITLTHRHHDVAVVSEVTVSVAERSPAQQQWLSVSQALRR